MPLEWLRVRAAGDRLHHRRFDLQETLARHEFPDHVHDAAARLEHAARLLAHDEVHVALAVPLLLVGEPVEFLRQRPERLHEQAQARRFYRELAGLGLEQGSLCAEDVAEVVALEGLVRGLADAVAGDVELDAPAHVLDRGEARLAHDALEHHAAGNRDNELLALDFLVRFCVPCLVQVGREMLAREIVGEGGAALSQLGELGAPLRDDLVLVVVVCHSERSEESAFMFALYHASLRSSQVGLLDSIKAIFFIRSNPFICFSRSMAADTTDVYSKCTNRSILYILVNPAASFCL